MIDDERDLADVAGALLDAYATATRVVHSAKEGLQALEQDPEIDAIFPDLMMPEMTGVQLALLAGARNHGIK